MRYPVLPVLDPVIESTLRPNPDVRLAAARIDGPRGAVSRSPAAAAARAFALAALVLVAGCGTLTRNPVPPELARQAEIAGMPDVRAWRGALSDSMEGDLVRSFAQESRDEFPVGADGHIHYAHLALSGGGANGAFGAGFLNGWTKAGTRPTFKIVTGVSTGALMAPFAFLGPAYDDALREFYTTTSSSDIFTIGTFSSIASRLLTGDAIADSGPLEVADRAAYRRRTPSARGGSPPCRTAPVCRHRRPRRPALRGVEHGPDRVLRPPGGACGCSGKSFSPPRRSPSPSRRC